MAGVDASNQPSKVLSVSYGLHWLIESTLGFRCARRTIGSSACTTTAWRSRSPSAGRTASRDPFYEAPISAENFTKKIVSTLRQISIRKQQILIYPSTMDNNFELKVILKLYVYKVLSVNFGRNGFIKSTTGALAGEAHHRGGQDLPVQLLFQTVKNLWTAMVSCIGCYVEMSTANLPTVKMLTNACLPLPNLLLHTYLTITIDGRLTFFFGGGQSRGGEIKSTWCFSTFCNWYFSTFFRHFAIGR
jgi:hypothetical protein